MHLKVTYVVKIKVSFLHTDSQELECSAVVCFWWRTRWLEGAVYRSTVRLTVTAQGVLLKEWMVVCLAVADRRSCSLSVF